jgi:hypothetical protein
MILSLTTLLKVNYIAHIDGADFLGILENEVNMFVVTGTDSDDAYYAQSTMIVTANLEC